MNTRIIYRYSFSLFLILCLLFSLTGCLTSSLVYKRDRSPSKPEEGLFDDSKVSGSLYTREMHQVPVSDMASADTWYPEGEEPDWNTEEYKRLPENPFLISAESPLSTFAADVDTASYANIRRFLKQGTKPVKDAVRIEEMLNYFTYDYPAPESSDTPFSLTVELAETPWNKDTELLLLGFQTAEPIITSDKGSNLVFLIDVSGSMYGPDRIDLVKRAYLTLLDNLSPYDRISIVTYAGEDRVLLEGKSLDDRAEIMSAIESLDTGGGTHGSSGILRAYEIAKEHYIEGGNNRILLATDGDLNIGITSEGELGDLVSEKKEEGVFLSVLGFGSGNLSDTRLEALANRGNGEYYYIDSIEEARRVLGKEVGATLFTVAKDVKFQVDFNPYYIKGYRLIGYENRVMEAQDFRDDSKDGGEIGAGHSVTVLYEIVRPDSPFELKTVSSKYENTDKNTGLENDEMLTVFVRYKEPDGDTSVEKNYPLANQEAKPIPEAGENISLASSIAEFGLLLKDSEYRAEAGFEAILERLEVLNSYDPYVVELYKLVETARDLP